MCGVVSITQSQEAEDSTCSVLDADDFANDGQEGESTLRVASCGFLQYTVKKKLVFEHSIHDVWDVKYVCDE